MTMIATNITDLQIKYYKLAKEMNIDMNRCLDDEVEIYEKNYVKGVKFARGINKLNKKCKVTEIAGTEDTDVRGNVLEGCTSLYLTDDEYYIKLIGEEVGQASMF